MMVLEIDLAHVVLCVCVWGVHNIHKHEHAHICTCVWAHKHTIIINNDNHYYDHYHHYSKSNPICYETSEFQSSKATHGEYF